GGRVGEPGGGGAVVTPAVAPRGATQRLLVVPGAGEPPRATAIEELPEQLAPGDLLVVNDAFTWPASLEARTADGRRVEIRLAGDVDGARTFLAITLGDGDHTVPTEARGAPPALAPGDVLALAGGGGEVTVVAVDPAEPTLVTIRFEAPSRRDVAARILRAGRPVQYAHVAEPLALWDVQTPY